MQPHFIRYNELVEHPVSWDYHIHTVYTDGSSTIPEYIESAIRLGLTEIAFTEHVHMDSDWFDRFIDEILVAREQFGQKITIFHGIEAKALNENGDLDASNDMLEKADIIIGAVHRYPGSTDTNLFGKYLEPQDAARIELQLSKALLKNPHVDVLAHPGGIFRRRFNESLPSGFIKQILHCACDNGKAIEINSSYLNGIHFYADIFSDINPLVSLGSDCHSIARLGDIIKFLKSQHIIP